MNALERLKDYYQKREHTAKTWHEQGSKVVGYIGIDVPEELIMAAGFFPLRITGDPASSTALADKYVGTTFNPMVLSMFNRLLDGTYAFLDHVILSNSNEAVLRMFYCLREIKRLEPCPNLPDIYFFEFLHTKFRTSILYNRDRVRELKEHLETRSGQTISDDALDKAITVCNENRRLLEEIARLRLEVKPRLSGKTAVQIIGAAMRIAKDDHNKLLRQLLAEAGTLPEREGARIFIEGSSPDHLQFYDLVESSQVTIVAEDSDWGNRYFDTLVDKTIDPLEAISDRYQFKAPGPTKSTIQERVDYCLSQATRARADGVIFFILQNENPPSWDYPEQRKALEASGIPTLCLPWQPYDLTDTESLRKTILSFIKTLPQQEKVSL